jgi:hypothetical protein
MADSWRDILRRAATSVSIDLDRARPSQVQYPSGIQGMRRRSPGRSYSEARALLERELEAISARPMDDQSASVDRRPAFKQRKVPRTSLMAAINAVMRAMPTVSGRLTLQIIWPKRLPWRSFLAICLSATIIGLSAQMLLNRGGKDAGTSVTRHSTPTTVLGSDP